DAGQEWLRAKIPVYIDVSFYIQNGTREAQAGSFLPLDATQVWGKALFGFHDWELDRKADPTFIPHDSALDIVNGTSKFDGDPIMPIASTWHDDLPSELVEPILTRTGFPPPPPPGPLSVSVSGPTSLNLCQQGTWTATVTGGTAPYA